ncbi:3-ketoacyl-CoA thiolase 2, peroxisomal [Quillaja saponaria]|uniref:3-ketoacyl-CoA thiolase 2, peroxisomal n=1 Tax=Quillaja saponaria TaxID=32244 RepID=A0AAD7QF33_QUISA|nr:3-ketoacyl-CoA thiolase 2, peroxisomal [Quillaja saponaria]
MHTPIQGIIEDQNLISNLKKTTCWLSCRTFTAVGVVDPVIMGIGPAAAIPTAVKAAGLELDDINMFEINEAFASQFVCCRNKLELDSEKINVIGGSGMRAAAIFERGDSVAELCNAKKLLPSILLS